VRHRGRRLGVVIALLALAPYAFAEDIVPPAARDVTPKGATHLPPSDQP